MTHRALSTTFEDPGNIIDDAVEAYGGRERYDDELFACCPVGEIEHVYEAGCGVVRCVHCKTVVAR